MFIVPMNGIAPMTGIKPLESSLTKEVTNKEEPNYSFSDIFKEAMKNVEETQQICEEDSVKVALGEIDDLHTVMANSQKAALALQTLVTMKNTAVTSYNEVMRMSI